MSEMQKSQTRPTKIKYKIAVAAGKGGVGKSTTAVNLAWGLSKKGYKVGLLDADIYGPSLVAMTKAKQDPDAAVSELVSPAYVDSIAVMSVAMFTEPHKPQILRGPMAAKLVTQLYSQTAWGELDFLIIDYPPGTGDIQLSLSQSLSLDGAVLVTTPQQVACLDVRKAIEMFRTVKVPVLGIAENMSYFLCTACDQRHYLFGKGGGKKLAEETSIPFLGEIPLEERVCASGEEGHALVSAHPASASAVAFINIAEKVAGSFYSMGMPQPDRLVSFQLNWR